MDIIQRYKAIQSLQFDIAEIWHRIELMHNQNPELHICSDTLKAELPNIDPGILDNIFVLYWWKGLIINDVEEGHDSIFYHLKE